ncbi:MAG: carboxypeptidase-like regulatory domain-containing protein [Prolixibacteraceae bacterium]|nr:carboxypeptidase-like regulatory domain-containing protein [Prolixibacteraceae bacterium]
MEKLNRLVRKQYLRQKAICLFVPLFISLGLGAQNKSSVKGYIIDRDSNTPVPFATVRLLKESDTAKQLITGTMSNGDGTFIITPVVNGNYKLQISSIGYKMAKKDIVVNGSESIDAGTIGLHDSTMILAEATVTADRVKGKSESEGRKGYGNQRTRVF